MSSYDLNLDIYDHSATKWIGIGDEQKFGIFVGRS